MPTPTDSPAPTSSSPLSARYEGVANAITADALAAARRALARPARVEAIDSPERFIGCITRERLQRAFHAKLTYSYAHFAYRLRVQQEVSTNGPSYIVCCEQLIPEECWLEAPNFEDSCLLNRLEQMEFGLIRQETKTLRDRANEGPL